MKGQQQRLVLVIAAISSAQDVLLAVEESKHGVLTPTFQDKITQHIRMNPPSYKIDKLACKRSIYLSHYFLRQKKYLAGYTPTSAKELDIIQPPTPAILSIMKHVLEWSGEHVPAPRIAKKYHRLAAEVQEAMCNLTKLGLGEIIGDKTGAKITKFGRETRVFVKKPIPSDMQDSISFAKSLTSVGVSVSDYKKSMEENTSTEVENSQTPSKRPFDDITNTLSLSTCKSPRL